jgi:cytochrome b561
MAAIPERLLHALRYPHARISTPKVLYGCIAILTVAIGGLSLVDVSPLRQIVESWINIHLLFELFLFTLVIARYRWCVQHSPRMKRLDIKELSRHLSRIVYLVLYGVIGFREIIALVSSISHGGAVDFNLFNERLRNGPDNAVFNPRDDFQVFLASGLLALLSVRALAYRLWLRSP